MSRKEIKQQNERLSQRLASIRKLFMDWENMTGNFKELTDDYDQRFGDRMAEFLDLIFDKQLRKFIIKKGKRGSKYGVH